MTKTKTQPQDRYRQLGRTLKVLDELLGREQAAVDIYDALRRARVARDGADKSLARCRRLHLDVTRILSAELRALGGTFVAPVESWGAFPRKVPQRLLDQEPKATIAMLRDAERQSVERYLEASEVALRSTGDLLETLVVPKVEEARKIVDALSTEEATQGATIHS